MPKKFLKIVPWNYDYVPVEKNVNYKIVRKSTEEQRWNLPQFSDSHYIVVSIVQFLSHQKNGFWQLLLNQFLS